MNFTTSAPHHPGEKTSGNGRPAPFGLTENLRESSKRVVYLRLFWERRRLLRRVALYSALASVLIVLLIPNRYRAKAQLMPPEGQQGLGTALMSALSSKGSGGALAGLAGDLVGSKNTGAVFVSVLKSRTVADRLINEFRLWEIYGDSKMEDLRDDLEDHSDIAEDRKSGVVSVSVSDHDPKRAAAMARAYVDELDRLVAQVSTSAARRERVFLEGRLQEVKAELDTASKRFSEFASKNTALDIPAQSRAMMDAAATLQGQLIAAQSELSGLEQIYAESNVRVRSLKARINELRQQMQRLGGSETNPNSNEGLIAPPIRKLPLLGVTYADLYRQTKIEETVYELLTQQYEMAKVQEAKEIPSVKVLDAPVVPTKKYFPPRLIFILLGVLLGVGGASAWLIYLLRWNEMDPHDPGRVLAQEVGASVWVSARKLAPAGHALKVAFTRKPAVSQPTAKKNPQPSVLMDET